MGFNLKLNFWFLNTFGGGKEVQKGHLSEVPASRNRIWQKNGFTYRKKESYLILAEFLYQTLKTLENLSFGTFVLISDSGELFKQIKVEFVSFARWHYFIIHL